MRKVDGGKMNKEDYRNELKPRQVTLQLSDIHCEEIFKICGSRNLTVSQLLETFLKDLLGEEPLMFESNECALAKRWLEEYDFYNKPNKTLLKWLHDDGADVEEFSQLGYEIDLAQEALNNMMTFFWNHTAEEVEKTKADLKTYKEEFEDYKRRYLEENPSANWEKEMKDVRTWLSSGYQFLYPVVQINELEESVFN